MNILEAIARNYERRQAGRTGEGLKDIFFDVEELLSACGAQEGEARAIAEQQLRDAEKKGIIYLDSLHKRDKSLLFKVRFNSSMEELLYSSIGQDSPTANRKLLADQFNSAAKFNVPAKWCDRWVDWCNEMQSIALRGGSVEPFSRLPCSQNVKLLELLAKILAWEGESLVRFASCLLCGDSKSLELVSSKLARLLDKISHGQVKSLEELGIIANPRFALIHGPLELTFGTDRINFGLCHGAVRVSSVDILRATGIQTSAKRCLTVENETSFHELAKLQSGELLVQTSFPGSGTLALLRRLPPTIEYWHFGDSDDAGFEILETLRQMSGREFRPLHMQRGKLPFEQEAMGRPQLKEWPFYRQVSSLL